MKCQPNRNYKSNDVIYTPVELAERLLKHFNPQGKGLEPCKGSGNIYNLMSNADWCEISEEKDFFDYHNKVDYIFTNPPWSNIKNFMEHSFELADEVYFLITINHVWTKARIKLLQQYNFGIKEICLFDTPSNFPQMGFQLGMVHFSKKWAGDIKIKKL